MTVAKGIYRRRRPGGADGIPESIRAWFAGERAMPWEALLPGDCERVPAWWAAWLEAHPGATPPADAITGQFEN